MVSEYEQVLKMGSFGQLVSYARRMNFKLNLAELDYADSDNEDIFMLAKIGECWLEANPRVDTRERGGVFNIMEEMGFEVCVLETGDVVAGSAGFERKSGDFFSSVFDRRIFKQMHELKITYPNAFLVIDRNFEDLLAEAATRKISENAVFGALASCCIRGFPPIFADNKVWATKLMNAVSRKSIDGRNRDDEYDALRGARHSSNMVENMLFRFPNFGANAVQTIMANINGGSLQDAFNLICSVESMSKAELKETGLSKIRKKCINASKIILEPQASLSENQNKQTEGDK